MRLDDSLNYSPWHIYRVPGVLRYATKLALDARYGEGRWRAPYAPFIETRTWADVSTWQESLRREVEPNRNGDSFRPLTDFIQAGVRPGDRVTASEISTQIALYGNAFVAPKPRRAGVIEAPVRNGLVAEWFIDDFRYVEFPGDFRKAPISSSYAPDSDVTTDGEKVPRDP